jgi:MerR family copper efflux transcriptional regulator
MNAFIDSSNTFIGEASKVTGLSIKAIRFYEEKGLIQQPERIGRYRVYHQADIEILILIKEAKELGVSLSQLKNVITYSDGKVDWAKIKIFLAEVRIQLINQIDEIKIKIDSLDQCYEQINP